MTNRLPYSTIGGVVTRGETFAQLLDYLRLCSDCCQRMSKRHLAEDYAALIHNLTMAEEAANVIGHLYRTEDDERSRFLASGWLGVGEMLHNNRTTMRQLALSPHTNRWAEVRKVFEKIIWNVQKMYEAKRQ